VHAKAALARGRDHRALLRERLHGATAEVVRVLEHDQLHVGLVVGVRRDRGPHLLGREVAARAVHHARHHAGDLAHARELEAHDVAAPLDQHLVAALGQEPHRDRVAHRARGHEECRLLPSISAAFCSSRLTVGSSP
jgi:hypothetical protein